MTAAKLTKVAAGWYATEDGTWAVINDGLGYISVADYEGDGVSCGVKGDEWDAIYDAGGRLRESQQEGESQFYADTKRECVDYLRSCGVIA
jgi:hypothetical protein